MYAMSSPLPSWKMLLLVSLADSAVKDAPARGVRTAVTVMSSPGATPEFSLLNFHSSFSRLSSTQVQRKETPLEPVRS